MTKIIDLEKLKIIDLTHELEMHIPCWEGGCGFKSQMTLDYSACSTEVKFRVQKFEMLAGIGTHIDAPAHCIPDSNTVDKIPLKQLISPCVVINIADKAHENYCITEQDVLSFENENGIIANNSFVIFYTGWEKHWQDPKKYRNNLIFPSVSTEAADILVKRNVVGLGIDTLSPDIPSSGFPVHRRILGANKFIVENVAHAHQLPAVGAYTLIIPIKVSEATEAPIRLIGLTRDE